MGRSFLLIIDGLGIGEQEDSGNYGDEGADTLGNVSRIGKPHLPYMEQLGLGNIRPLDSIEPTNQPLGYFGKMREQSAGKDSTTGHWELAGIELTTPFPTYPEGFPEEVTNAFCALTHSDRVLCNLPYSGTQVIHDFGGEHMRTGNPIVYTSADSVFQVACHVDVTPVDKLYEWCEAARADILVHEHAVGRVIARPFRGVPGDYVRVSEQRHDFSLVPPEPNLMSLLQESGVGTYSIGKIIDLFAGVGFTQFRRTKSNAEGISQLLSLMSADIDNSFTFINLIDTDQIYGHRQDPVGFARCLEEIDRALPAVIEKMNRGDLLIITGDHGNDPADNSTDHTREFVPLIVVRKGDNQCHSLGIRNSFSDVALTVLDYHKVKNSLRGESFLSNL
jgi:phosphopentomutase